jgi:hypothetical protein
MDPVVENQFDDAEEFNSVELIHGGAVKARGGNVALHELSQLLRANSRSDSASVISRDAFPPEEQASNPDAVHKQRISTFVAVGNSSVTDDSSVENDGMSNADASGGAFPFITPEGVTRNDVVCGRGKGANNFIGNRNFRDLVMHYREAYWTFPRRADKRHICYEIIDTIHSRGGRFLVKNDGSDPSNNAEWIPIPLDKILVKVSQALREGVSKWNKATQKFNESKGKVVAPSVSPAMCLLAEISSRLSSVREPITH